MSLFWVLIEVHFLGVSGSFPQDLYLAQNVTKSLGCDVWSLGCIGSFLFHHFLTDVGEVANSPFIAL